MSAVSAEPPNAAEIERQDDVPLGAERGGDPPRRLELDPVALAVVDGEREQPKARLARAARRRPSNSRPPERRTTAGWVGVMARG